jgi:prolyl-tRNA synthetase
VADNGEDEFVRSPGGYAANVEAVTTPAPGPVDFADAPAARAEATPDTPSIETLVDHLNARLPRDDRAWTAADTLKNVLVVLRYPDGQREALAIGVPGDREVDLRRLEAQVSPAEVEPFDDDDFAAHPDLVKGYIGPEVLGTEGATGIRYLVDPRVVSGSRWVTGANVEGSHVIDLVAGRDFAADGTIEAAEVRPGDPAPDGSGPLEMARGIEMGHIFQLGTKYAAALGLQVLDENGKLTTVTMGSYGIGVSRAVAAVVENSHDELGIVWPRELAPYDVHLVAAGKDEVTVDAGERMARELEDAGLSVLHDDRPVSPGVKFKDAELLGMPTIVIVGRGLSDGVVEVRDRSTGERENVPVDQVVSRLTQSGER